MNQPRSNTARVEDERLRRWRLILGGGDADGTGLALNGVDLGMDRVLAALYDSERQGGLGASALLSTAPRPGLSGRAAPSMSSRGAACPARARAPHRYVTGRSGDQSSVFATAKRPAAGSSNCTGMLTEWASCPERYRQSFSVLLSTCDRNLPM